VSLSIKCITVQKRPPHTSTYSDSDDREEEEEEGEAEVAGEALF